MSDLSNNKDDDKENNCNYISESTKKTNEGKRTNDTDI